jgi:transcriptional regulator GlxA family with amidase domain
MPITYGAVLFEGFELLDVFGPFEAFGMLQTRSTDDPRLVFVAERAGPVASAQGPRAVADHGFGDCPDIDVLLVPGGVGTRRQVDDDAMLGFLRRRAQSARIVCSVCTGAALLARAGLLDGKRATGNKAVFQWVVSQGPAVKWVPEARWVEDGMFWTSSGVSAGIDMALAIVSKLHGAEAAEKIVIGMEYEWHRDASWDPFARIHGLVKG